MHEKDLLQGFNIDKKIKDFIPLNKTFIDAI
jgi:hypothetical protein